MKLKKVKISEFRSVRDSNEFEIGDITCLVGKNESGKTALLQALYKVNPINDNDGKYDVIDEYPRSDVADYQDAVASGNRIHADVCIAIFEFDDTDIEELQNDYGRDILSDRTLQLSKSYSNEQAYHINVNERVFVSAVMEEAQIPSVLRDEFDGCQTLQILSDKIVSIQSEDNKEHMDRLTKAIEPMIKEGGMVEYIISRYILSKVPKFLYFSDYYQMLGQVNIEKLNERKRTNTLMESDMPLLGLIELARLEIDDLLNPDRTQDLKNKLEGAGNRLTKTILKYWSQNKHISMKFDVRQARPQDPEEMTSGTNFWSEIYDSKHWATTPLGRRSRGFVWFFSFLAYFSQQKHQETPVILLLDEPGLSLHAKAQSDLLRYIEEEIKDNHQVIYTTHSPFMVDPAHFERVRIVQDIGMEEDSDISLDEDGTRVISEVLDATDDSLFPLQGALGYEIHQTLFVGPYSLIVEGVSDLLYIQVMSAILERKGKVGIDRKWTIVPVGGAGKVPAFVSLLGSQKRVKIATLIDIDNANKQMLDNLIKKKLLKKNSLFHYGQFLDKNEADIEDLFDNQFYVNLVNQEYDSSLNNPIQLSDLNLNIPRIVKSLEAYFETKSLSFNHYRPARYFSEQINDLESGLSDETFNHFEEIFEALNKLI